ncbi:MAG: pyrroline-5-carboxylate reductase [Alistipes sp.]|jgi:pyrroline-5-carboxylate reductase|nr:pyrroline-5-carboxylate reductase [Alistipes sp.]
MKATIIGAGNLGGAIARGLAKGTFLKAEEITCVDPNPSALERLASLGLPFNTTRDLKKSLVGADIIILAVKEQAVPSVLEDARGAIDPRRQLLFSTVAGLSIDALEEMTARVCGDDTRPVLFRVMPNIAVSVGESMTFISSLNANADQTKLAERIFGEMGRTMVIPERLMPAAMAVASCGLAYAMRYVRAAMNGAVEAGFSAAEAHDVVLQTVKGAVDLLARGEHPEAEIDRVTSPGGYTIRGLNAMEEKGFSSAVVAGIRESYKNSR